MSLAGLGLAEISGACHDSVTQGKFLLRFKMQYEKSADTKVIETVLKEAKIGDIITYDSISLALGRDVRVHAIAALQTARKAMLASNVVFGTERNVGLVRLNDTQIIDSTESDRQKIQRVGKRSLKKLGAVKFEELGNNEKLRHTTMAAQLGAISMFASKSSTNKIQSNVKPNAEVLAIGETLSIFTR